MRTFDSLSEVDSLTDEEARAIIDRAWECLEGIASHRAYGLDDHGDYLMAAVDNYSYLVSAYITNDGDEAALHDAVVKWLRNPEWGGSDGEIRFELFTKRWQEESWKWNDAEHNYWVATHPEEHEQIRTSNFPVTRETVTEATKQWDADVAATENLHWEEWPIDVRNRIAAYKK